MSDTNYRWLRTAGQVSSIALLMLVSTGIGLLLGNWLDSKLRTSPWLAFVLTIVGFCAGIYESIKILIKAISDEGN